MDKLALNLWCEVGLQRLLTNKSVDNMEQELQAKLKQYKELKEFIKEYNAEQYQKGLDLGARIMNDLICKYPYKVGACKIDFEDDYHRDELILKVGSPFNHNGSFFRENEGAKDYILERYPDAQKHYLGIKLAQLISKRNIDKIIKEYEDEE